MRILIIIGFIFLSSLSLAQDAVIAIGEAELDKDKLVIDDSELKGIMGDQKTLSLELNDIIRNDFSFYKHKFNNVDYSGKGENSFSNPTIEKWKESGITYFVSSQVSPVGSGVQAKYRVWSIATNKEIFFKTFTIDRKNLRVVAHQIADGIYQSITAKPSIFNSKIVFLSNRTTSRSRSFEKELYIMDFDGRRVEKLTNFKSVVLSPSVSPDNSKIMFSLIASHSRIENGRMKTIKNIDLKMLDLRTMKIKTISDRSGINSGATFSADGFNAYLTLSFTGNAEIYEMNLASGKLRKLTSHGADDVDPSVTRDGTMMAFLSNRAGKANIYTMDPSATEKNVSRISFVGQFNATPRFSPEGKEIVFSSWVDNSFDLYRISADGNNLSRLTKDFGSNEEPVYSPDGEFIVFTSKKFPGRNQAVQDVYIMNRDGEILGQLTQDFGHCFSPQWTNLPK